MSTAEAAIGAGRPAALSARFMTLFVAMQLLAAVIGHELTKEAGSLPVIWPAAGVLYAAMLVAPPRHWAMIGLAGIVVQLVVGVAGSGGSMVASAVQHSLVEGVVTALQAIAAAWLFKEFAGPRRKTRSRIDDMVIGLVAAALSAAVGSLFGVLAGLATDGTPIRWLTVVVWWGADFFAMTVFAPALIPALRGRTKRGAADPVRHPGRQIEFVVVTAGLACFVWLGLGADVAEADSSRILLLPLLTWPALLWLAARLALHWVAIANTLMAVLIAISIDEAHGIFVGAGYSDFEVAISAQFYLCVTAIVTLGVATVVCDRRRRGREVRREVDFEKLLRTLSQQLQTTDPQDLDDQINQGLAQIGQLVGVRRCSLIFVDRLRSRFDVTHYWHVQEVGPLVHAMQSFSVAQFSALVERLERGEIIETGSLDDLAPAGDGAIRTLRGMDLKPEPLTLVPVSTGEVIACVALVGWQSDGDSPAIQWLLVMLAQLFVNALKRRDAEQANEQYQQRLKALAAETLLSDERARRQTATFLHDGIGQSLAILRVQIASMKEHGADRDQLEFAQRLVMESMRATRDLIKDLSPSSILHDLGLTSAFTWMTERLSREHGIAISFEASAELPQLTADVRTLVFQAGREMCMNAVKHATANHIAVLLSASARSLTLSVRDDGCGFDPASTQATQTSGFGLFSLRERLTPGGGALEVQSAEGGGTLVRITVPLGAT